MELLLNVGCCGVQCSGTFRRIFLFMTPLLAYGLFSLKCISMFQRLVELIGRTN
jgi:hypothetical protein